MTELFAQMENVVDTHLRARGKTGLLQQQRGRCQTTSHSMCKHGITPNKPSRQSEVAITYMGENFLHTKWTRQLRRLQSLCKLMNAKLARPSLAGECENLWTAIKAAPGFSGGFAAMWKARSCVSDAAPLFIPKKLPSAQVVESIFTDFRREFLLLENALIQARCRKAKETRIANSNAIYRDVSKPRALPVTTVVVNRNAVVSEISVDGLTVQYQPPHLSLEDPVSSAQGPLGIAHHSPGVLQLAEPLAIEPGDHLTQPCMLGDLPDVFKAFDDLWRPMWQKHRDKPVTEWFPTMQEIQARLPQPAQPMALEPITVQEWNRAVQAKKASSAVGPDGISKQDLQSMPPSLTARLVDLINDCERGEREWPQATMLGLIAAVEKHSAAASPSEYRPITVLSMVYRTYSSIRTRQILKWIHQHAPDGLFGNMPKQSTVQVWRSLAEQIEYAHYLGQDLTGMVTDVCKCFNTLPRHIVYFLARHMGLPAFFVKSWHRNLAQLERRFVVQGACSPALRSHTGYAEGDPLSVVSMALVNCAMHVFVTQQVSPVTVISYVDNWEAQSSDPASTCSAFDAMDRFAQSLDIKLDKAKTHCWGTNNTTRKALKSRGHEVVLHTKDLGGHLNYSKRGTNYSLRSRITQCKPLWGWLSRSHATATQKLRVLHTVAWPRCLHGIAAVDVGRDHFTTLRASAMNALRWEKHGSSSGLTQGFMRCSPPSCSFASTAIRLLHMRSWIFWLLNRHNGMFQDLVEFS